MVFMEPEGGGGGGGSEETGADKAGEAGAGKTGEPGGGGLHAFIPEDLRADATVKQFMEAHQTPEAFVPQVVKALVSTKKLLGDKRLRMPDATSKPEELAEIYDALGRPKDADGYDLGIDPKTLPEGLVFDEDVAKEFKAIAHQMGMSDKQVKAIVPLQVKIMSKFMEAQAAHENQVVEESGQRLLKQYGSKEAVQEAVNGAKAVVMAFGGDEAEAMWERMVNNRMVGNDADVISLLASVQTLLKEDNAFKATLQQKGFGSTDSAQAEEEIGRLMGDQDFMGLIRNNGASGHKEAKQRWENLIRRAAQGKKDTIPTV